MIKNFCVHSICVIENEEDIIEFCLREALKWSDFIYVYDLNSSDKTWDIVKSMGSQRIIPWKQSAKPFSDGLRGEVFNAFKGNANEGDWWCRLDSDEFYVDNPKVFLSKISYPYSVVSGIAVEYYLASSDLAKIDFNKPIKDVLADIRYYKAENSEIRFFRHSRKLNWPNGASWPKHLGVVYNKQIVYRHYKYRSLSQIETRLRTRQESIELFEQWKVSFEDCIVKDTKGLSYDNRDGKLEFNWKKIKKYRRSLMKNLILFLMKLLRIWP